MSSEIMCLVEHLDKSLRKIDVSLGFFGKKINANANEVPCFYKLAPSQTLSVMTDQVIEHKILAHNYLKQLGEGVPRIEYVTKRNFEVEEQGHLELFSNEIKIVGSPYVIYSRNLIDSAVMGFYQPLNNSVCMVSLNLRLFNISNLERIANEYINDLGQEINASFVVSRCGKYSESALQISGIQKVIDTYASKQQFNSKDVFISGPTEIVSYVSMDSKTGDVRVKTKLFKE